MLDITQNSTSTINLKVKRIKDTVAFYRAIGFAIPTIQNTTKPLFISGGGGNYNLSLIPVNYANYETPQSYNMIEVYYPTCQELNEAYDKTVTQGYESVIRPWNTFWGTRSAKLVDPDGNDILLFTYLK